MKNYSLKLYKKNGKIEIVRTRKKRRFLRIIRTINWQSMGLRKTYIKACYGKKMCNSRCLCDFYNDGYYNNKEELLQAFKYFDDED